VISKSQYSVSLPISLFFSLLYRSKIFTYDEVVEKVAEKIGVDDPSKIRLTSHNCYSQQPKPQPIKYRGVDRLLDMLIHYNQVCD
jgi:ubiquitin carboxyl-terminal hydrolase 7